MELAAQQNVGPFELTTLLNVKTSELTKKYLVWKEKEKDENKDDNNTVVIVYNLQAVLQYLKSEVSGYYYVSRINVFNFTMYELKARKPQTFCFV